MFCDLPCPHCGEVCFDIPDEVGVLCPYCKKPLGEQPEHPATPKSPLDYCLLCGTKVMTEFEEALELVPAQWRADFVRFVEEGKARDEFLAFLEQSAECRQACEMALRADYKEMVKLLDRAVE